MKVIKRDGTPAPVDFNRVDRRNRNLARPDLIPVGKTLASSVNRINMSLTPLTEIDPTLVSKEVLQSIYNGVTSVELDEESAKIAQTLSTHHPQYGKLAARIYMSNYHKNNVYDLARNRYRVRTPTSEMMENIESNLLLSTAEALWKNTDKMGNQSPLLAPHVYVIIQKNHERFEQIIDYSRDFTYDFIGMNIMEGAYLLKANLWNGEVMRRVPIERPQHMLMRVAIGIHCSTEYVKYSKNGPSEEQFGIFANWLNEIGISDAEGTPSDYHMPREIMYKLFMTLLPHLNFTDEQKRFDWADYNPNENYDGVVTDEQWVNIEKTYKLLSLKLGTHATPTLFNAGTLRPQCSSCYLIMLFADSLEGIAKLFNACMHIQKWAGGIGSHCHNLRAAGTYIRGTNGTSNGLGPYARVLDAISVYIDQCFDPKTIMYTKDGIKTAEQVSVGDKMMTNDGTFQKVTRVMRHNFASDETVLAHNIVIMHALESVLVTGKHPVYALKQKMGVNYDTIKNRLNKGYIKPDYVNVEDITDEYLIGIPIPKYIKDYTTYSEEDCYMYGLMLGDGSISETSTHFTLTMNDNTKIEQVEFARMYLNALNITFSEQVKHDGNCRAFVWTNGVLFPFNRDMLYDGDGQKKVHKSLLHLPKKKTINIIMGLLDSDGCIGKKIMIELTSRNVIESIRFMLLRLKIGTSGYIRDSVGETHEIRPNEYITTKQITYVVRIPFVKKLTKYYPNAKVGKFLKYFIHKGILWSRVKSNTPQEHSGIMIDYEIENNHNYLTHMGLVHNGGGKRPGSHAIYLEPWHGDIFTFLELRKHRGDAEDEATKKARGMFYAIWNCDEFMWRLENSETKAGPDDWYLMCPDQCPGLSDVYNAKASPTYVEDVNEADHAFSTLYRKYISEGRFIRKVKATEIWNAITELQTENGLPYVMNKDNVNRKNQQANLGVIKSSNLCTEIVEYTSPDEVAVCNLASICLPAFIVDVSFEDAQKYPHTYNCSLVDGVIEYKRFDMEALRETVEHLTFNLDQVIDINYYPIPETKRSNMRHRPIGLGVQGLADTFAMLRLPFNSQQAVELDYYIFEMIYFASLTASNRNAQNKGPYETFQGSPASKGLLQFDLLKNEGSAKQFETVNGKQLQIIFDQHQDWAGLKANIAKYGLRNSLCIAPMPTASTSYIMGNSPCFEPFNSNVYKRAIKSGVFVVVNDLLINDLISLGLWNADMKKKLIMANGSVQQILDIPKFVRDIYVTAWDISPKWLMYHEISRSGHIDQSQSANRFIPKPNPGILTQIQFFAWRRGLKTGSYYIHSRPPTDAQKLQMEDEKATSLVQRSEKKEMDVYGDMCLECGS
jgi:ribonucleoside-diphosphate reductase alpha subunit